MGSIELKMTIITGFLAGRSWCLPKRSHCTGSCPDIAHICADFTRQKASSACLRKYAASLLSC